MKKRLSYLRYLTWWLGLIKDCPKCKSKLIITSSRGWKLYKCSNPECDFGKKPLRYPWEVWK